MCIIYVCSITHFLPLFLETFVSLLNMLTLTDRAPIRTLIDAETIIDRDPKFFLVVHVYLYKKILFLILAVRPLLSRFLAASR